MACPKIEVRGKRVILLSGYHDTVKAARPQVVIGDSDVRKPTNCGSPHDCTPTRWHSATSPAAGCRPPDPDPKGRPSRLEPGRPNRNPQTRPRVWGFCRLSGSRQSQLDKGASPIADAHGSHARSAFRGPSSAAIARCQKPSLAGLGREGLRAALAGAGVPEKQLRMRVNQL